MKSTLLAAAIMAAAFPAFAQAQDASAPFLTGQAAGEWRMNNYIGKPVFNASGERVGDIAEVLFDKSGRVTAVVIGVGGFMGMGAKSVALPYQAVTYGVKDGERQIIVPLTKEVLLKAPDYKLTEKTTLDKVREKAGEAAEKASETASELKEKAKKKIEEYRKE
jgi:sporulation protein YlmC with PRC-barrel domain